VIIGRDAFNDWAKVVDCGDAPLTWLDNRAALRTLDKAHELVSGHPTANKSASSTPRIMMLGGDHTTTLSALRSTKERWGPVSVIHFDSHIGKQHIQGAYF
jgi:agmatinase